MWSFKGTGIEVKENVVNFKVTDNYAVIRENGIEVNV